MAADELHRVFEGFNKFSAKPYPPVDTLALGSRNCNSAEGYLQWDRGYAIRVRSQTTPTVFNKAGASFTHFHTDGTQRELLWFNTALTRYEPSGPTLTDIATGLTEKFAPAWAGSIASGVGTFFPGDNTECYGVRVESTVLTSFLFDMDAPTGNLLTGISTPTTGGSLADGVYLIRAAQVDSTGARTVISKASDAITVTLTGGTTTQRIVLDLTQLTFDARAVSVRIFLSVSADSPDAFFQSGADTAKATATFTLSDTTVSTALAHRNLFEQVAKMPLAAVDSAVIYQGRLVIASSSSNLIYWSEVADTNHFYTTSVSNRIPGPVYGLGVHNDALYVFTQTAVYQVTGDLGRNDDASVRLDFREIETGVGTVSGRSIVSVPEVGLFFMSQFGPCVVIGSSVMRLKHDDFADFIDRMDFTYADRWVGAWNPRLRQYLCAITRKTNATRPFDGAINAGICDWIWRWNLDEMTHNPPLEMEVTHLALRPTPATEGTTDFKLHLMGMGPHGSVLQIGKSHAHGVEGDCSGSDYQSKVAQLPTTTTARLDGVTGLGNIEGLGVSIRYPSGDSTYPNVETYRTVKKATDAGGNTTIEWEGTLPTPSGTGQSMRLGGFVKTARARAPMSSKPDRYAKLEHVTALDVDRVGVEARS